MAKSKNKTVIGVIGLMLTLFGAIFTIPIAITKEYLFLLPVTMIAVIIGVILMAKAVSY